MFSGESLSTVLHALALHRVDDASEVVATSGDIDEELRKEILDILDHGDGVSEKSRRIGDELRSRGADRGLVNECYRVAFYTGADWRELSDNPMFAYFSGNRAGAPLDKWIHYFPVYTRHLEPYRDKPVRILEIGVYRGGGLALLQKYLGPDASIVGLDVDPVAVEASPEFTVEVGDQENPDLLRSIHERHGPFDVVIDDGGHTIDQQIVSAETLFPLLNEGGTYIVEDCHTSYWPEHKQYASADPRRGTFIDWVKARIDDMNSYHFSREREVPSPWGTHLDALHVYDSVVVLQKVSRFAPFSEVSGLPEFATQSRQMAAGALDLLAVKEMKDAGANASEVLAVRDAALVRAQMNEVKASRAQTDVSQLRQSVVRLEQELGDMRSRLEESTSTIREMRHSRSWRLTLPFRSAMAKLRHE